MNAVAMTRQSITEKNVETFLFYFIFLFSLTSLSRLFHSYRDEPIGGWGERKYPGKIT